MFIDRRLFSHVTLMVASLISFPLLAEQPEKAQQALTQKAMQSVRDVTAESGRHQAAIDAGRDRTVFCRTCHGEDGLAKREKVPNLAGQNAVYLYIQLANFASGLRYDYMMANLAKSFSEDDLVNIALYYSSLPLPAANVEKTSAEAERGGTIYQQKCLACHGAQGLGDSAIPRVGGQRADYVIKMLTEFRQTTGRRTSAQMSPVAATLKDRDISDLASYLSGL